MTLHLQNTHELNMFGSPRIFLTNSSKPSLLILMKSKNMAALEK